ncbi:putative 20S pre-rRNA protein [Peziza echinospora]|nr:putative 20S pre-rRNA protein [Peziza echinospora]
MSTTTPPPTPWELGVSYILHLWPALTVAVEAQWGGPNSSDKRDWLCGTIADMFTDAAPVNELPDGTVIGGGEPDEVDVEETLLQVMQDEFEVGVDDDSSLEVARDICSLREKYLQGNLGAVEAWRTRYENRRRGATTQAAISRAPRVVEKDGDETDEELDDEDDDDEEDSDEEMGGVSTTPAAVPRERLEPVIDDDGFELVQKRRR